VAPDGGVSIDEPSTSHPGAMKSRLAIGLTGYPWPADRAVRGIGRRFAGSLSGEVGLGQVCC
jgi:hypothetical protein